MTVKSFFSHVYKVITKQEFFSVQRMPPYNWLGKIKDIEPKKNALVYKTIVSCSGCGFSGSSAVTDFLAEFDNCSSFGGVTDDEARGQAEAYEVDFFRDTHGLYELEKILCSPIYRSHDEAVKNFIKNIYDNYNSKCPIYDEFYLSTSKKFINKIINFELPQNKNRMEYVPKQMSEKEFRELAKDYIDSIFKNIESKDFLVLDQFLSLGCFNFSELDEYFNSYKIIAVWSDPRDMYIRAMNHHVDWVPRDPVLFVKQFCQKTLQRYFSIKNNNFLLVSFDELCYNYENETKKIKDFLGLNENQHIKKMCYFNPEQSKKNTHLWKSYVDKDAIMYIYNHLKDYCIN